MNFKSVVSLLILASISTVRGASLSASAVAAHQAISSANANYPFDTRGVVSNCVGTKKVALTFDDGPHPENTPKLLDYLKSKGIKATFFLIGSMVDASPALAKRIHDEGHAIGSHTYSHPDLITLTQEQVKNELDKAQASIKAATGLTTVLMRPPLGSYNDAVVNTITQAGYTMIIWNVDSNDWQYLNYDLAMADVKKDMATLADRAGVLTLFHDIISQTTDNIDKIVQYFQSGGYSFIDIDTCIGTTLSNAIPSANSPAAVTSPGDTSGKSSSSSSKGSSATGSTPGDDKFANNAASALSTGGFFPSLILGIIMGYTFRMFF